MNKQEKMIVVLLFALLLGWFFYQDRQAKERAERMRQQRREQADAQPSLQPPADTDALDRPAVPVVPDGIKPVLEAELEPDQAEEVRDLIDPQQPEKIVVIANEVMRVEVSSWGGAITGVELTNYSETVDAESGPVRFDFSKKPALAIDDLAGLSARHDFALSVTGSTAVAERTLGSGLRYVRTMTLTEGYQIKVEEIFENTSDVPLSFSEHTMGSGFMETIQSKARARGQSFLELNALGYRTGSHVERWREKQFAGFFGASSGGGGCTQKPAQNLQPSSSDRHIETLAWGAAKNRFFVQILAPVDGSAGCRLHAERDTDEEALAVRAVAIDMIFPAMVLEPGTTAQRETGYYIGPSKYSDLKALGKHQDQTMLHSWQGWGWFRSLSIGMLWTLNRIYDVIPNYGVAIILLTILVRIIFWPITRKSTADMKKMQDLKPMLTTLKEKYKDNPKRMQEETWALYRKNKVNPMTSCLPMVVQMPVFVALFNVLRGAVELRFASFLWIRDLSEPEGLLQGVLPFDWSLNILPILMTATTFMQQKLTPSSGDPAQQKMMMFMPLIMLLFFYNFASALALYWTVSQALAIAQMLGKRRQTTVQ